MDRLLTMRVFQTVADEGGFAAAARALGQSAAAVTRAIADLESHVGARLLHRTTRKVTLTEAGTSYLARVRHILRDVDEALGAAQANTSDMAGVLTLLTTPVMAVHILAPVVSEFRRLHPQVRIDIHVDTLHAPSIEGYDLTLMSADAGYNASVIARPIVSTHGIVCASPTYVQQRGLPASPQDLVDHDCLALRRPGVRAEDWEFWRSADAQESVTVALQPCLVSNHTETLLRATLDGAGISAQPLELVAPYLCDGRLVQVLRPWITGHMTLYAALPSRKFMPARTRVFMEFLTERMRTAIGAALDPALALPQGQKQLSPLRPVR